MSSNPSQKLDKFPRSSTLKKLLRDKKKWTKESPARSRSWAPKPKTSFSNLTRKISTNSTSSASHSSRTWTKPLKSTFWEPRVKTLLSLTFSSKTLEWTASNWSLQRSNRSPKAEMHLSRRKNHLLTVFWKISASKDWRDSNRKLLSLPKKKEWRMSPASWTPRAQLVTHLVPSRLQPKSCSAPQSQLL